MRCPVCMKAELKEKPAGVFTCPRSRCRARIVPPSKGVVWREDIKKIVVPIFMGAISAGFSRDEAEALFHDAWNCATAATNEQEKHDDDFRR